MASVLCCLSATHCYCCLSWPGQDNTYVYDAFLISKRSFLWQFLNVQNIFMFSEYLWWQYKLWYWWFPVPSLAQHPCPPEAPPSLGLAPPPAAGPRSRPKCERRHRTSELRGGRWRQMRASFPKYKEQRRQTTDALSFPYTESGKSMWYEKKIS